MDAAASGAASGLHVVLNVGAMLLAFVAYMNFSQHLKADDVVNAAGLQVLSTQTKAIISFALCGFANLSSIAILMAD